MKKIPSLFQRTHDGDRRVRDEIVSGCEWVLAGEGVPTRKYDGTCCLILCGHLFKRYNLRPGKPPPPDFFLVERDESTGKAVGWVPVGDGPEDQWHRAAWDDGFDPLGHPWAEGTYELLGPNVQGNPEGVTRHVLWAHAEADRLVGDPRDFASIRGYLATHDIEGIVWHHPDGRMAKIKAKDFGLRRGAEAPEADAGGR